MKLGNKKIFNDQNKLNMMLNLRMMGYSEGLLAFLFHCDEDSIKRLCKKYFIVPGKARISMFFIFSILKTLPVTPQEDNDRWATIDGERINRGKTYADYLAGAGYTPYPKLSKPLSLNNG